MYLSQKHISRRTVLKGVGAAVALPLLDAMNPAATAWARPRPDRPKRFALSASRTGAIWTLVPRRQPASVRDVANPAAAGAVRSS